MKTVRELRIRFEAMGPRPRVYWRKRDAAPAAVPQRGHQRLQIELRDGSVFIDSVDGHESVNGDAADQRSGWEEVNDSRAAWTSGVRVAVDFAEEFPDTAQTIIGMPMRRLEPVAIIDAAPAPNAAAPHPLNAETRILDTQSLYAALGATAGNALPDLASSTRFFDIEERAAAGHALPTVPVGPPGPTSAPRRSLVVARPRALLLALVSLCALALFAWRLSVRNQNAARAADHGAGTASPPSPDGTGTPHASHVASAVTTTSGMRNTLSPSSAPSPEITTMPNVPSGPNGAERTLERRAADAIETGAFSEAAVLYDELARQHPDSAVYREAARIVRAQRSAAGRSTRATR